MNQSYTIILLTIIGAIIVLLFYFFKIRKSDKQMKTVDLARKMEQIQTSPKGLKIFGKVLPQEILEAFDESAQRYFDIVRTCRDYKNKLDHKEWSIFIIPSFLSPEQRMPSYYYPKPKAGEAGQMMIAGEYLLSDDPSQQCWIAIADPQNIFSFSREVIHNELEHGGANNNNPSDFLSGAIAGHQHPLYADCRTSLRRNFQSSRLPCGTSKL